MHLNIITVSFSSCTKDTSNCIISRKIQAEGTVIDCASDCALQGSQGWDVLRACNAVKKDAQAEGFEAGVKAAAAIHKRASRVSALLHACAALCTCSNAAVSDNARPFDSCIGCCQNNNNNNNNAFQLMMS